MNFAQKQYELGFRLLGNSQRFNTTNYFRSIDTAKNRPNQFPASPRKFFLKKNLQEPYKDIFVNNTSPKLKKYSNINIYNNIIEKNEKIIQILDKPYLEFFNAFYKKVESINLNKYGFNIDISLSDIKGFEYFLIEQSKSENSDEYLKKIEECIKDEFIPNSQMFNVEKY